MTTDRPPEPVRHEACRPPGRPAAPLDWERLERLALALGGLSDHGEGTAERARRLAERIEAREFYVAVLGDFKRGKSTLVNALVGSPLLPTGSVPLTSVATEVRVGTPGTVVVFEDGTRREIGTAEIGSYATEAGNPENRLGVDRVEVGVETSFGVAGLVLVDTPGASSVHEHNTAVAHDLLLDSDAGVVVLSADTPLSESDARLLVELEERGSELFVVINKSDHLSDHELAEVRAFVTGHIRRLLGRELDPYCVSAREAVEAEAGAAPSAGAVSFRAFRHDLDAFVHGDLTAARWAAAVGELQRLGAELEGSVRLEEAATQLDIRALEDRLHQFEVAAADGRRLLGEDQVLLDHEVDRLVTAAERTLTEGAARSAEARTPELASRVSLLPRRQLEAGLRDAVQEAVVEEFDPLWRTVQDRAERSWQELATRFSLRMQERVDAVRRMAGELFAVHLPMVEVPEVAGQRERFSYLFLHVEGPTAAAGRLIAGALLPAGPARRMELRRARRQLAQDLDKHAGRARHDLDVRLRSVARQYVDEASAEFERTEHSIAEAIVRARRGLDLSLADQEQRRERRGAAQELVDAVRALATAPPTGPG